MGSYSFAYGCDTIGLCHINHKPAIHITWVAIMDSRSNDSNKHYTTRQSRVLILAQKLFSTLSPSTITPHGSSLHSPKTRLHSPKAHTFRLKAQDIYCSPTKTPSLKVPCTAYRSLFPHSIRFERDTHTQRPDQSIHRQQCAQSETTHTAAATFTFGSATATPAASILRGSPPVRAIAGSSGPNSICISPAPNAAPEDARDAEERASCGTDKVTRMGGLPHVAGMGDGSCMARQTRRERVWVYCLGVLSFLRMDTSREIDRKYLIFEFEWTQEMVIEGKGARYWVDTGRENGCSGRAMWYHHLL